MLVTIKGKQVDLGDALRGRVEAELTNAVSKYFAHPLESQVELTREAHLIRADITVHAGRGIIVQGQGSAADARTACDSASSTSPSGCAAIASPARPPWRASRDDLGPSLCAPPPSKRSTAKAAPDDGEATDQPVIIAELTTEIATLSVSDAVMRLDLRDEPALLFRHAVHGGLNLVYRRTDGNIGWVDPQAQGSGKATEIRAARPLKSD